MFSNALRGILLQFDPASYAATVQVDGSRGVSLSVPVSRGLPPAELLGGRKCAILEFWPNDPNAAVLVAVWP